MGCPVGFAWGRRERRKMEGVEELEVTPVVVLLL